MSNLHAVQILRLTQDVHKVSEDGGLSLLARLLVLIFWFAFLCWHHSLVIWLLEKIIVNVITRQDHDKGGALPLTGIRGQRASALFHEQLDHGQADPQAGGSSRRRSIEKLEHLLVLSRR